MPAIRSIIIGFVALMLTGCGQLVSEKLSVSDSSRQPTCTGKKVVILPFADYSYTEDAARAFRRNMGIMDNLTARLTENGFRLPVQDDLLKYLADNNIVKLGSALTAQEARPGYVQSLLASDDSWSPALKKELTQISATDATRDKTDTTGKGIALDQPTLAKIASSFNADLVMRGRIIKYDMDEENTWDPTKRGLLPVVFGGANRALFGVTNSQTYDELGSMAAGALLGGVLGTQTSMPYDSTEKLNPERFNAMAWGLGGAALGYLSSKGGHANQAAVQLRLWVQDPKTGEVVWTNSVKVLVKPQSVFAETREDKLFDTAITQAIAALIRDFTINTKSL